MWMYLRCYLHFLTFMTSVLYTLWSGLLMGPMLGLSLVAMVMLLCGYAASDVYMVWVAHGVSDVYEACAIYNQVKPDVVMLWSSKIVYG
jgi:hypothetical protein